MQRRLDRDGERRRAGIGPQPQVGAEDIAVAGAVLQDAHQPPRQPRTNSSVAVERIEDRRRVGIEEHDQVDVGREIELVRAELAHAEHDPAGALAGIVGIGQLELALRMGIAQQEIDGRADAGVGKIAQPAHRRLRHPLRRRDRPARSGNAPRASACAAPPSALLSRDALGEGGRGNLGVDRRQAARRSSRRTAGRAFRAAGGRNRAGNRRGRRRRRGSREPAPPAQSSAASRGRPASAAAAKKFGEIALALPRGRAGRSVAAGVHDQPDALRSAAAALAVIVRPFSGKHHRRQ